MPIRAITLLAAVLPRRRVMTRHPGTTPSGSKAIEALALMRDGGFRHVPTVAEESMLHRVIGPTVIKVAGPVRAAWLWHRARDDLARLPSTGPA